MDSIQPSFSGKNPAKPNQPFEQTNLRNSIIKSINDLLPAEGQALHTAAKVHFQSYGKLIRGITALMMAQAVGLDKKCGINWALSVELMHNASLVHDDICDGDTQRRKNSTVWSATSERTAICFGDWLVARSFEAAIESCSYSNREKLGAVSRLAQTMIRLCEGQSSEFETPPILDWHSYDKVVLEKTSSLILAAGEGPLLLGGVIDYQSNIKRALSYLGIAYQINNDIDDIAGKNLANPLAQFLSFSMMLRYSFDQNEEADLVERSVSLALETGKRTSDIMSAGCQEVGTKEMTKTVIRKMDELAR